MKHILCYGDSNTHGSMPTHPENGGGRHPHDIRWTGVLQRELGAGYRVIEEGLPGRTTVLDDPYEGEYKNGKRYLIPCLESHEPLDLIVLMLGTNDLKHRFGASAWDITRGCETLILMMQSPAYGVDDKPPHILLMSPPPLTTMTVFAEMFAGGTEKSKQLAENYRLLAGLYGCSFFDAGSVITTSPTDGVHFDAPEHTTLGKALAEQIQAINWS